LVKRCVRKKDILNFNLEKIDLSKVKNLYFLRGYETEEDDNYCLSLILLGDEDNDYSVNLFLSRKTLTITNWKELMKYAKESGLELHADTLKADFEKFYNSRSFERIKI